MTMPNKVSIDLNQTPRDGRITPPRPTLLLLVVPLTPEAMSDQRNRDSRVGHWLQELKLGSEILSYNSTVHDVEVWP